MFNSPKVQQSKCPTVQQLNGAALNGVALNHCSNVQQSKSSTVEQRSLEPMFKGPKVERFNCSKVQLFKGSTVQRSNGPTVEQRSFERRSLELLNSVALEKRPTVERRSLELLNSVALEKSPKVQMFKCSTVQQLNGVALNS